MIDAMVPRVEVMRSIPSISSAVSQFLVRYDDQADQEALPGKSNSIGKWSSRYNVTETSSVSPSTCGPRV